MPTLESIVKKVTNVLFESRVKGRLLFKKWKKQL